MRAGSSLTVQPSSSSCSNARSAAQWRLSARPRGGVERGEDLVARSLLGEVANRAGGERLVDDLGLGERGEQDDGHVDPVALEAPQDFQTVECGHPQVQQRDIGPVPSDQAERDLAVAGRAHDAVAPCVGQRPRDAVAIDGMVVGDHDAQRHDGRGGGGGRRRGVEGGGRGGHGVLDSGWGLRDASTVAELRPRRHPPGGGRRG